MPSHTTQERAKNKGKKGIRVVVEIKPVRKTKGKKKWNRDKLSRPHYCAKNAHCITPGRQPLDIKP